MGELVGCLLVVFFFITLVSSRRNEIIVFFCFQTSLRSSNFLIIKRVFFHYLNYVLWDVIKAVKYTWIQEERWKSWPARFISSSCSLSHYLIGHNYDRCSCLVLRDLMLTQSLLDLKHASSAIAAAWRTDAGSRSLKAILTAGKGHKMGLNSIGHHTTKELCIFLSFPQRMKKISSIFLSIFIHPMTKFNQNRFWI